MAAKYIEFSNWNKNKLFLCGLCTNITLQRCSEGFFLNHLSPVFTFNFQLNRFKVGKITLFHCLKVFYLICHLVPALYERLHDVSYKTYKTNYENYFICSVHHFVHIHLKSSLTFVNQFYK